MATISGGEKLKAALSQMAQGLSTAASVDVGFLENSTYPDGKPTALIAAIQEFGAPSRGIPPRPYFRSMISKHEGEWPDAIAAALRKSNYEASTALALVGAGIKGQLQQSIIDLVSPPLKPATIKRKGFDKPLIDTSHMLNSADFRVE